MKIVSRNWQRIKPNELEALEIARQPFEDKADLPRFSLLSFDDVVCVIFGLVSIGAGILFRSRGPGILGAMIAGGLLCLRIGLRHVGHAAKVRAGSFDVAAGTVSGVLQEMSRSSEGAPFEYYLFVNGVKLRVDKEYYTEYRIGDGIEFVVVDGVAAGILERCD